MKTAPVDARPLTLDESDVAQPLISLLACARCEEELNTSRNLRGYVVADATNLSINKEQISGMSETRSEIETPGLGPRWKRVAEMPGKWIMHVIAICAAEELRLTRIDLEKRLERLVATKQ